MKLKKTIRNYNEDRIKDKTNLTPPVDIHKNKICMLCSVALSLPCSQVPCKIQEMVTLSLNVTFISNTFRQTSYFNNTDISDIKLSEALLSMTFLFCIRLF